MSLYLGNYAEDYATLNFKFTTRAATGVPTSLVGGVVKVYKANETDTEINTGVTLTADFDTVTGLNNVLIDLSAAAFYATGQDYAIVITVGTVGGVSVVGEVVACFSIENRFIEADLTKINGTSVAGTGTQIAAAFIKFLNVATPTGTVNSLPDAVPGANTGLFIAGTNAATAITTALTANIIGNITGTLSGAVGSVTGAVGSISGITFPTNFEDLAIVNTTGYVTYANTAPLDAAGTRSALGLASANMDTQLADIPTVAEFNARSIVSADYFVVTDYTVPPTAAANADAVCDELLSGHVIVGSLAAKLSATAGGSGALTYTVTVNDGSGNHIDGAEVWITTDADGDDVIAGTITTDASGIAVFTLDAGTYFLWKQKSGMNFTNPETIVVS